MHINYIFALIVQFYTRPVVLQAKSKYEYVRQFEQDDALLPGCWIVVRIDGKGFTKCADCAMACQFLCATSCGE